MIYQHHKIPLKYDHTVDYMGCMSESWLEEHRYCKFAYIVTYNRKVCSCKNWEYPLCWNCGNTCGKIRLLCAARYHICLSTWLMMKKIKWCLTKQSWMRRKIEKKETKKWVCDYKTSLERRRSQYHDLPSKSLMFPR